MVYIGTELKLNFNIEPIDNYTMDDYDFKVEIFTSKSFRKIITIEKSDDSHCKRIDANNYLILINTTNMLEGELCCKVIAYIPDKDFPDKLRTEIDIVKTGIIIKRNDD